MHAIAEAALALPLDSATLPDAATVALSCRLHDYGQARQTLGHLDG
ncbi:hypothetical protein [Onishia niordana]|nr:hypothetical protein [Halomonas niordiana]